MTDQRNNPSAGNLERRTIVKGAAWSVPVLVTAVASPMAAASEPGPAGFNATVTGRCSGNYDLSLLESIVGSSLTTGAVRIALSGLGLEPNAARTLSVTATEGNIPVGTVYSLTGPAALIDLSILQGLLDLSVLSLVQVGSGEFQITVEQEIPEGGGFTVDLFRALLDIGAADTFTLTQLSADDNNADNAASVASAVGIAVDLGSLGVLGVSGTLAIQVCA